MEVVHFQAHGCDHWESMMKAQHADPYRRVLSNALRWSFLLFLLYANAGIAANLEPAPEI